MPLAFVALLLAAREELVLATRFSDFVEMIYMKGKAISIDAYISKYIRVAAGGEFYTPRWNYEEIPVEAIKLDKISLGHKIGAAPGTDGQRNPAEDKLIEDNMDRILKENVLPEDQEVIPQGEGLLLDPSLLKDLDKEAVLNSGKKSTKGKKKKTDDDPLMGDYKSVKKAGTKDGSSKRSVSKGAGIDILSDMPKADKKATGGKVVGGSSKVVKGKDSNKTFSLPLSDTVREPSKKKPAETSKSKKDSKRSAAEEEMDNEEEQSKAKKSDSKVVKARKPASKSKDKEGSPAPSKKKLPPKKK